MAHKLLVLGQFILSTWIILGGGIPLGQPIPTLLAVVGFLVASWAIKAMGWKQLTTMPTPRPGAMLIRSGPYRWIRHPMYTGLLLFCAGFVIAHPTPLRWLLWVALMIDLFLKTVCEEKALQLSVAGYGEYCQQTKRFIPLIW